MTVFESLKRWFQFVCEIEKPNRRCLDITEYPFFYPEKGDCAAKRPDGRVFFTSFPPHYTDLWVHLHSRFSPSDRVCSFCARYWSVFACCYNPEEENRAYYHLYHSLSILEVKTKNRKKTTPPVHIRIKVGGEEVFSGIVPAFLSHDESAVFLSLIDEETRKYLVASANFFLHQELRKLHQFLPTGIGFFRSSEQFPDSFPPYMGVKEGEEQSGTVTRLPSVVSFDFPGTG